MLVFSLVIYKISRLASHRLTLFVSLPPHFVCLANASHCSFRRLRYNNEKSQKVKMKTLVFSLYNPPPCIICFTADAT